MAKLLLNQDLYSNFVFFRIIIVFFIFTFLLRVEKTFQILNTFSTRIFIVFFVWIFFIHKLQSLSLQFRIIWLLAFEAILSYFSSLIELNPISFISICISFMIIRAFGLSAISKVSSFVSFTVIVGIKLTYNGLFSRFDEIESAGLDLLSRKFLRRIPKWLMKRLFNR